MQLIFIPKILLNFKLFPYFIILIISNTVNGGPNDERPTTLVPITKDFIARLEDESLYNKYATPTQHKGLATNVSMSMFIEGISSFSAQTMDYQLDVYMYQKLWRPDIYFANARQASFQSITEDNFYIWIFPNGRVWYDLRISIVAICMMNLWKYPLDSQTCELRILSYAYPESHLRLRWFNFWLDIDTAPARVTLSITTLLTIETQANAVKLALPEVSYMKAIDSWMGLCLAFVFAVMVEYTIAHFAKNQELPQLFQTSSNQQPPLVVDSETLQSIFNAANALTVPPENGVHNEEDIANNNDIGQFNPLLINTNTSLNNGQMENNKGFLTSEQMHRHWRKKVCGVLSNGSISHKNEVSRNSSKKRKNQENQQHRFESDITGREDVDSEVSSKTTIERQNSGKNHLSVNMFNFEDPRLKRISR
uniref:Neur_chan_LBD domain-containing protein n=1 Tax=Meloidogyne hapla TaxID=6305 RepID=A0A1I8BG80_MELHA